MGQHTYTFATKKARLAFVKQELATKPLWALKALELIYQGQTEGEKAALVTNEDNGVGFTAFDAEILTSLAQQARRWDKTRFSRPLSEKQMALLFKRIGKYAGQVINHTDAFKIVGED